MFKLTALQSNTDTKGQQPNPIAFKEILVLILYSFFFFFEKIYIIFISLCIFNQIWKNSTSTSEITCQRERERERAL